MATLDKVQAATEKHSKQHDSLVLKLLQLLLGLWSGFDRWDDTDAVTGMAARSATLVDAATLKARLLTRSYMTTTLRELDALPASFPPVVNNYPRANTDGTTVYQRPVDQFIWRRRNGGTLIESQEAFEERLREIAETDMRPAERDEANLLMENAPDVIGYRRIIHPELSKSGTCGLCIVASAQVYHTADLMPLHGRTCHCDTMPITADSDPGLRLNDDDLKTIYAAAGSTAAEDLQNTRITINEHGELGPVLVKQGDHFKTAKETGRPDYRKPTPATIRQDRERERANLVETLAAAQARYDAMPTGDPISDANAARVPLFRSIGYMRERINTIDAFLATLPA